MKLLHSKWYNSLDDRTKTWLDNQPVWFDKDIYKAVAVGIVIGLFVGFLLGFELGYRPVVMPFKPLVG